MPVLISYFFPLRTLRLNLSVLCGKGIESQPQRSQGEDAKFAEFRLRLMDTSYFLYGTVSYHRDGEQISSRGCMLELSAEASWQSAVAAALCCRFVGKDAPAEWRGYSGD